MSDVSSQCCESSDDELGPMLFFPQQKPGEKTQACFCCPLYGSVHSAKDPTDQAWIITVLYYI